MRTENSVGCGKPIKGVYQKDSINKEVKANFTEHFILNTYNFLICIVTLWMIVHFNSKINFLFSVKTEILLGRAGGISHFVFQYFLFPQETWKINFHSWLDFFPLIVLIEPKKVRMYYIQFLNFTRSLWDDWSCHILVIFLEKGENCFVCWDKRIQNLRIDFCSGKLK